MDARHRRSRAKLAEAVLRLASERPIDEVTASEIAAAAGVNRSTFYAHAASPLALLESVLREELDTLRDRHLASVPRAGAAEAVTAVTLAVLSNIESHAAIYERGLLADGRADGRADGGHRGETSLRPMLAAHFEESSRQLLAQHALFPSDEDEAADPLLAAMVGPFVANGSVGAIAAWLEQPEPRDPEAFLRSYRRLVPSWFPLAPH
ncbi:TetR/AcrR family transcriptional regulator [Herbiconiux sp. VKM Ac-1786]|uniref:TetR/AcrR family transcriptional regulator n=1 Tax=Herbiconiux sp. VKM Ac-1786 TaxID=2783824 RepID=UPI00188BD44C|nr:TetR/AcrR family transcriptional regulator [Herbiconiux sp. VKM Ac-1786]MBF4572341.1 TetR/AcrR family transcriptional regulator [Herbiconiux sp. VKM Ac-1786]